uniref:Uncharacterized protein n=1 Tax=Romanomermis culicivorax TaxID=13658 RepID=A0A915JF90_ROMCU
MLGTTTENGKRKSIYIFKAFKVVNADSDKYLVVSIRRENLLSGCEAFHLSFKFSQAIGTHGVIKPCKFLDWKDSSFILFPQV